MANKKISELVEATEVEADDLIAVVQNGTTKKVKKIILQKELLIKVIQLTTICTLNDASNGYFSYSISKILEDDLTKKEIGYASSISLFPTYTEISNNSGYINSGEGTKYITLRLTYSDIGQVEVYIGLVYVSGGGLACFTSDTLITTINGLKEISKITKKDEILTNEGYKKVVDKYSHVANEIYYISVDDNFVIKSSWSHPFNVVNKGRVLAKDLKSGDILKGINGIVYKIKNINIEKIKTKVYEINTEADNYIINDKIIVYSENLSEVKKCKLKLKMIKLLW